jgi:hypothetical protein
MDPRYSPMRLLRIPEPFDQPDFLFEPTIGGFRALAYVEDQRCERTLRVPSSSPVTAYVGTLSRSIVRVIDSARVALYHPAIPEIDPAAKGELWRREHTTRSC